MEQRNQRLSGARSSRVPLLFCWIFCVVVVSLGAYATFIRGQEPTAAEERAEREHAPDLALGESMSKRLSQVDDEGTAGRGLPRHSGANAETSFWGDYTQYLAMTDPTQLEDLPEAMTAELQIPAEPAPKLPQSTPRPAVVIAPPAESVAPAEPTLAEQLQMQLQQRRAEALLQALSSSSSLNNQGSNSARETLLGPQGQGQGQAQGQNKVQSPSGQLASATATTPHSTLTPLQQRYFAQGQQAIGGSATGMGSDGSVAGVGSGDNLRGSGISSEQTLSAYEGLVNNDTLLQTSVETVLSPFLLRQGTLIPCVLLTGINSDLPGLVQAQVVSDVYDTPRGNHVLIPRGSKIIGQYASAPMMGQERLMLGFNRVIFPDGKAMSLGAMPGSSTDGYAGFNAEVDNHFWRLMGNSILLGGITAGIAISVDDDQRDDNGNLTLNGALSQGLGQSIGRVLTNVIERNMAISPTLTVEPGFNFNVTLTKDIYFPSQYQDFVY